MTWLMLSQIAAWCEGTLYGEDVAIERVERDSRQVQKGDLFLALKGERFDAHAFLPEVAGKASAALVSSLDAAPIAQIVVEDVRLALGRLAAAWRSQFIKPVVGLTGSNGKTTLKEMITAILALQGRTLATLGNLNNDIGVPLTLLRLRLTDEFAVIEMGANHFGEIEYLTQIARPDVAVINNAGAAHLEGFGDIAGVAKAKGEIFQGLTLNGIAVINADDTYADYWIDLNDSHPIVTFGLDKAATVQGQIDTSNTLHIAIKGERAVVDLKLLGRHNQMNALAAAATAWALGVSLPTICQGLAALHPMKGRLYPKQGLHGGKVIDDTYNANPTSTAAAVEVLASFKGKKIMVLGDMGELGEVGEQLHAAIGLQAKQLGIDTLYTLGKLSAQASQAFGAQAQAFMDLQDLLTALRQDLQPNTTVLVKGSRSARMERVVEALTTTTGQEAV